MGAAAPAIAVASSLASAGFAAYGETQKAAGTNAADQAQASRLERAAEYGKLSAAQTSSQLTERLNITLANIDTVRAAANTDPNSPTGIAVKEHEAYLGERQRNIAVENIMAQSEQDVSDAAYMRQAGSYALAQGNTAAFATLLKGFSSVGGAGSSFSGQSFGGAKG